MSQTITVKSSGADSRRVLDALTPMTGEVAPAVNAEFIGQIYIDTVAGTGYMSVAVGSETPADDWKQITFVA